MSKKLAYEKRVAAEMINGVEAEKFEQTQVTEQDAANIVAASKLEQESQKWAEKFAEDERELMETAGDLSKHPNLSIRPIADYVIVAPFSKNPFQQITVSESGVISDTGGYTPIYKNSDTGEYEEEEQYIFQGTVVEIGPLCKWIKPGDIVMWNKPAEAKIPFFKLGFKLVNENRLLCVINEKENLEKRF